jgi:hypothetical protein
MQLPTPLTTSALATSGAAVKLDSEAPESIDHEPAERFAWLLHQKQHVFNTIFFFCSIARYLIYIATAVALLGLLVYIYNATLFTEYVQFILSIKESIILSAATLAAASLISRNNEAIISAAGVVNSGVVDLQRAAGDMKNAVQELDDALEKLSAAKAVKSDGIAPHITPPPPLARNESHSAPQRSSDPVKDDYWDEVSDGWGKAKDYLDSKIKEFTNGNTINRYARYSRYNYRDIMAALLRDRKINARQYSAALRIADIFFDYRPQKYKVGVNIWREFDAELKALTRV